MNTSDIYAANSAGERRRIDLCIAFALGDLVSNRANKRFNILILDEVFDHLDEAGIESVMLLLNKLSSVRESVFVITHNDTLKARFSKVTTVIRENSGARVVSWRKT